MKINDAREHYYTHTGNLSVVNRQTAIAGIAIIWLFAVKAGNGFTLPYMLKWSLFAFILALFLDLLQYAFLSITWHWFFRDKEKEEISEEEEFKAPLWLNRPGELCFWLKSIANIIAFVLLGIFLLDAIHWD